MQVLSVVKKCSALVLLLTLFASGSILACGNKKPEGEGGEAGVPGASESDAEVGGGGGGGGGNGGGDGSGDGADPEGVRAFPGAQGFGALVTGGRGGRVLKVTTLAADGPGSLQQALDQDEPRIIVFAVSGVIQSDIEIPHGDVTIAGQTAPGAGITIRGRLIGAYDDGVGNIIIRHLRVRPVYGGTPGNQFDAIQFSRNSRVILDHISASFGVDETIDFYESRDVTVQWSTIESSATEGHPEGEHNYGLINGPSGARISVHHNLFAHHKNRAPAIANGPSEVRNNVVYNVRHGFIHHNQADGSFNIVGNYYKDGGDDVLFPFYFDTGGSETLRYYLSDNYVDDPGAGCTQVVNNPWQECDLELNLGESFRADSEFDFTGSGDYYRPVTTESSTSAYGAVLTRAGAFPRDVVTRGAVQDTMDRTGSWGAVYPGDYLDGLTPAAPPADLDDDGMADAWEAQNGLSSGDPDDHSTVMPSGYTAIEEYINSLAAALVPGG